MRSLLEPTRPARSARSGLYTASGTAGAADTVRVTDSLGNTGTAVVTVGPGIGISPANATVAPGGTQQFSASGGSGSGFVWSLAAGASGTVSASGLYTASIVAGADTLDVVDSLGNKATATITISAALAITPSNVSLPPLGTQRFTASGGAGIGYVWSVNGQGSINSTGLYTAGTAGSTTDTISVKDGWATPRPRPRRRRQWRAAAAPPPTAARRRSCSASVSRSSATRSAARRRKQIALVG